MTIANRSIERGIHRLSRILVLAAGAVLALMMFLTVADVILRYFFNQPILGAFELTEFMMAIVVFCGVAYAQMKKAHINVDVLINTLGVKTRRTLGAFTCLLGSGLFSLMTWQAIVHAVKISKAGQVSRELGLPISAFILMAAFGTAILCLVLLVDSVSLFKERNKR